MHDCPDNIDILRLFEGKCSSAEAARLWKHVDRCAECKSAMEGLAETDFLEREGKLPGLKDSVRSSAAQKLHALAKGKEIKQDEQATTKDGGNGVLGFGLGIGAILRDIARGLEGGVVPALGEGGPESKDETVRNSGHQDSLGRGDIHSHIQEDTYMSNQFVEPDKVVGTPPDVTSDDILQHENDTCAIRSQEIVLRDFGINVSEEQLKAEAIQNGWYTPGGGTPAYAVGNLLELHGVEVDRYENANIFNLQNELAQGHRVIVAVDSGELGNYGLLEKAEDAVGLSGADHALVVSSIDTSDPENVKVVLTDPGTGDVAAVYSQEQFQDAWKDSKCLMISTSEPAPHFAPGMENFDYAQGHVSHVGEMPYGLFSHYMEFAASNPDPEQLQLVSEIYSAAIQDYNSLLMQIGMPAADPFMTYDMAYYDDIAYQIMNQAGGVPFTSGPMMGMDGGNMYGTGAYSPGIDDPSGPHDPPFDPMDDGDMDFDHSA